MNKILLFLVITGLCSCNIFYPNRMFKSEGAVPTDTAVSAPEFKEFVIQPGDELSVNVFSNNGFELLNILSLQTEQAGRSQTQGIITFTVQNSGEVKLPVIDAINLQGYTTSEAEKMLKAEYAEYFNDPLVKLKVTNRRVIVFKPGEGGQNGIVVPIEHENTSLLEVLALAGGISPDEKSYKVKIIRGSIQQPVVEEVDLSTIEGLKRADLAVRSNDMIYIEPKIKLSTVLREVTPVLGVISTGFTFYLFLKDALRDENN